MIDTTIETIISLTEACSGLPKRRADSRPSVATLYRWSLKGCRGVILETIQIGGTRCTSREALQRFFDRLSSQSLPQHHKPVTLRQRDRQIEAAERELAES
jgi:hypothetical protein